MIRVMEWPGVESRESREALLSDVATAVLSWTRSGTELFWGRAPSHQRGLSDAADALATLSDQQRHAAVEALRYALSGLAHSLLVTLDGGAASCPTLELRDPEGRSLGDALHEEWPDFDPREAAS
jgi:hypothetical protein